MIDGGDIDFAVDGHAALIQVGAAQGHEHVVDQHQFGMDVDFTVAPAVVIERADIEHGHRHLQPEFAFKRHHAGFVDAVGMPHHVGQDHA